MEFDGGDAGWTWSRDERKGLFLYNSTIMAEQLTLSEKYTFRTDTSKSPFYWESTKRSKEMQGPTLGSPFRKVPVLHRWRCPYRESWLYIQPPVLHSVLSATFPHPDHKRELGELHVGYMYFLCIPSLKE